MTYSYSFTFTDGSLEGPARSFPDFFLLLKIMSFRYSSSAVGSFFRSTTSLFVLYLSTFFIF